MIVGRRFLFRGGVVREHGEYVLSRHGQFMLAIVRDAWNEETFASYANDVRALAETISEDGSWALVADARDWRLATPDALPHLRSLSDWADSHGLRAAVYLTDGDTLKEMVARDYIFRESASSRAVVLDNVPDAVRWLSSQGFEMPESIRRQL